MWDRPVLPKRAAEMQPTHRTDRPNVCSLACLGTGQEDAMEAGLPAADGGRDGVGDAVAEQGRVLQQHAHPRAAATCKKKKGVRLFRNQKSHSHRIGMNGIYSY